MTDDSNGRSLRDRAEAALNQRRDDSPGRSLEELQAALHDLKVYQIELELRNEELRSIQAELEWSRSRYSRLYNNAPIGN